MTETIAVACRNQKAPRSRRSSHWAAITIATPLAQKYPQLEQIFTPIAAKLDTAALTDLDKKVRVDGQKSATVARDWLKSAGFIS
ncbi:glycine betaine ABC transporter substrate-binding protein [Amycolatopsis sp. cmx-11-32]|uniref:glycine betaine ABC transporter substrate-binding protein n=1 Tax=Amycolatopsis sp. cmx-11-32 TaxID=2785796 RepID=UPI0039E36107